ncbi:MAG: hypothetical protein N3C62_03620 [Synergistetes bacterium]|nr:hypothetical protein [Synergistota bacterium]MCX8127815.1 hypothetical protein [Synergistota bacterium]MDW8192077.1 hypothetical protein [Synergistota bacterium]
MKRSLILATFLSFLLIILNTVWAQSGAQNINSLADEVKQLFSKGDYKNALLKARELYLSIWNKSPLFYSKAILVENEPEGVGMYIEKKDNKFAEGDPIYIYVEPMGYTVNKKGETYSFGLIADFAILDNEGNHLYEKKNFGTWSMESKDFNTEFFLFLRYSFTGIKPGKYRIITTLRDINDPNKKLDIDTPIEIVPKQ